MDECANKNKRRVDLRQCLLYIGDHLWVAVLVGLVFAAALGYRAHKQQNKQIDLQKTFESIVLQNRNTTYSDGTKKTMNTEKQKIDGSCIIRGEILTEFDFSSFDPNEKLDYSAVLSRLQQDAVVRMVSDQTLYKIAEQINEKKYDNLDDMQEITAEDIRWMINAYFSGANIMQYSITDVSTQRALDIAKLISQSFIEECRNFHTVKNAKEIEQPSVFVDMTEDDNEYKLGSVIKFAIVGMFGGIAVVVGVCLIIFLFVDRVRTPYDISYLGLKAYAMLPSDTKKRDNEYKRLAYRLAAADEAQRILFVPSDDKTNIDELIEKVSSELSAIKKDIVLTKAEDIKNSPESLLTSQNNDAIMLVASYGKTSMKDMEYAKDQLAITKKDIIGVVVELCKHR